jgi:putative peptide zinc metalloprotease protein
MALIREEIGSTFADMWYRVADMRPRVSVHARFIRQRQGPSVSYVIDDPAGGHFYRLSESARFFLGLLDGNRTVDKAWEACLAQLGDDAPTQKECIELLSQMQLYGLLVGDQPISADMVPERQARFRQQRLKQRTGNWMFFNIPLVNPEPILKGLEPYLQRMWGLPGLIAWAVLVLTAIIVFFSNTDKLESSFNGILDPGNLVWIGILFLFIRAIHEFGHAMACKAMGGRCTEIGVMLIAMLLPLPYCDASSSWKFSHTWRRVVVACGGMIVEFGFAALATFVWALAEPGLVRALAFNLMVISSVTTLLFNINPLLRYDGYYILCDIAGSPNLAQRAKSLWYYLIQKKLFGVINVRPPHVRDATESRLMLVYHVFAVPYRLLITFSILVIISTQYLSVGLILATFFAFVWFVWPVVNGVWFLLTSPGLIGRRSRSVGITLATLVPAALLIGLIPLPSSITLPGVVEAVGISVVRAEAPGYVNQVIAAPGDIVAEGDILFVLENPSFVAEALAAEARLVQSEIALNDSSIRGNAARNVANIRYDRMLKETEDYRKRVRDLTIRSATSGVFSAGGGTGHDIENLQGRYMERGAVLAVVIPEDDYVVRVAVPDGSAGSVLPVVTIDNARAFVRLRGAASHTIKAKVERVWPAGSNELESIQFSALTGGAFTTTPGKNSTTIETFTLLDVKPDSTQGMLPGRRASVRIKLEPSTLLSRIMKRTQQFVGGGLK